MNGLHHLLHPSPSCICVAILSHNNAHHDNISLYLGIDNPRSIATMIQDRILRKIDRDPTVGEMAEPIVEQCRRTLATGKYSSMARKGAKVGRNLPILIKEYCKNLSKAHSKYCHTAKIKVQVNLYLTYRGRFVSLPGGDYKLPSEAQDIDQRKLDDEKKPEDRRKLEDQEERWDIDCAERRHWKYTMENAKKQRLTSGQRAFIRKIENERRKLDERGIPNYVLTFFGGDWMTVDSYMLMVFPTRGRTGPFTIESGDGIGVEVQAWLELMRHLDHWTMRRMFVRAEYFMEESVSRPQSSRRFPFSTLCKANETDEDIDMDDEVDDQLPASMSPGSVDAWMEGTFESIVKAVGGTVIFEEELPEVSIPEDDYDPAYDTEEDAITASARRSMRGRKLDPSQQVHHPEVNWHPRPRPLRAQERHQASDDRRRRLNVGLGHKCGYVSLRHVQRQPDLEWA